MLVRLLYASRAAFPGSQDAVDAILATSRARNPALGITGVLCHGGGVFVQALEGGREAVNALYHRIARDERHQEVTLLHYAEISERHFAGWTMGQVNLARINPSLLLKYAEKPQFDPYVVSSAATLALLEDLIATASIIGRTG
jgi:hypothetical protein